MKKLTCCFTGHRNISKQLYEQIFNITKHKIEILIKDYNVKYFKVGGAKGFDFIAALSIIELKKLYTDINLILVLPCKNQDVKWNKKDRDLYTIVLENANEIIYISEEYTKNCMLQRNDKLLENSSYCICYLREKTVKGGTLYTINRAKNKDIKVYNINNDLCIH